MNIETLNVPVLSQINDKQKTFLIEKGGSHLQYYPFTATSYSNSNFNFRIVVPSFDTVVSKQILVEVPVRFVLVGDSPMDKNLFQPNTIAPRHLPLSSVVNSLTCNLNGQSITKQVSEECHIQSRFNNTAQSRSTYGSVYPSAQDIRQSYNDGVGSSSSAISSFDSMVPGVFQGRGAYKVNIAANSKTGCTLDYVFYEYVNLSPFSYEENDGQPGGLANIRDLTFNYNINAGQLPHMLSMALGGGYSLTSNTVTLQQPTMYCNFVTPPVNFSIPRSISYNYVDTQTFLHSSGAPLASDSSTNITSTALQFGILPSSIYLAVRKSNNDVSTNVTSLMTSTDTYCKIDRIDINFDNRSGLHASTTAVNLYKMSENNGLNYSWTEFDGKTEIPASAVGDPKVTVRSIGSVIKLSFGKDIPLSGFNAPSMLGTYNFQVTVQATNISTETFTPELVILTHTDGICTLSSPGSCEISTALITPNDVASAPESSLNYDNVQKLYGGNFGKMITGDTAKKLLKGVCDTAQALQNSGSSGSGLRAGTLVGGNVQSKASLKSRALR
mgnify:CR=1 FL=1